MYQSFGIENGLFNTTINDVIIAQGTERYFASEGNGLIHFRNGTFSYYHVPEGIKIPFISSLLYLSKDTLIIASENEVYYYFPTLKSFEKTAEISPTIKIRKLYKIGHLIFAHASDDLLYYFTEIKGTKFLDTVKIHTVQRIYKSPDYLYFLCQDTLVYRTDGKKIEKYYSSSEKILNIGFLNGLLCIFHTDKIIQKNKFLVRIIALTSRIKEIRNISSNTAYLIARISDDILLCIDEYGKVKRLRIHPGYNRFFLLENGELWVSDSKSLKCFLFPSVSKFLDYDFSNITKIYDLLKTEESIIFSAGFDLYKVRLNTKNIQKLNLPKKTGLILQILSIHRDTMLLNTETGLYKFTVNTLQPYSDKLDPLYTGLISRHPRGYFSIPIHNRILLKSESYESELSFDQAIVWHHWIDSITLCVQFDSILRFYNIQSENIQETRTYSISHDMVMYSDRFYDKIWGITDDSVYVFYNEECIDRSPLRVMRDNLTKIHHIGSDSILVISDQLYFLYLHQGRIKRHIVSYSDWILKRINIFDVIETSLGFFLISSNGLLEVKRDLFFKKNKPKIVLISTFVNGTSRSIILEKKFKSNENTIHLYFSVLSDIFAEKEFTYRFIISSGIQKADTVISSMPELYLSNLNPDRYTITYQLLSADNEILSINEVSFRISKPLWQQVWFLLLAITLLLGSSAYVIRWRTRQLRERVLLKEMLLETETKALRLQMNPHFLYNSLESIEGFILKSDKISAIRHLNNFTKLMRLILEGSDKGIHSLKREKDILTYYLDLEKMRSGNSFNYHISISPEEVIPDEILIPSMLIQPHVENSIIHGVRPLKDKIGEISINFTIKQHQQSVEVLIDDNGVGRVRSSELSVKNDVKSKSMALTINSQRLNLMSQTFNRMFFVAIEDKFDAFGVSSGTRVRIQMPIVKQ